MFHLLDIRRLLALTSFWSPLKEKGTITQVVVVVVVDAVAVVQGEVTVEMQAAMYQLHPLRILVTSQLWVASEIFQKHFMAPFFTSSILGSLIWT